MIAKSTPERIMTTLRRGRKPATFHELAKRVHATDSTTRRSISRSMERGKLEQTGTRRCKVTGKDLFVYGIAAA